MQLTLPTYCFKQTIHVSKYITLDDSQCKTMLISYMEPSLACILVLVVNLSQSMQLQVHLLQPTTASGANGAGS